MKSNVSIGNQTELALSKAILIYGGNQGSLATIHDVLEREGGARILGPGVTADFRFVRELADSLRAHQAPELLPDNVLCRTPEAIAWWTPARRRRMFFGGHVETDAALNRLSGKMFAHPALLWVVKGRDLSIFSLAKNQRPVAKTKLCIAPYWNTSSEGNVCQGSMRSPSRLSVDSMAGWEKAFFESEFTHATGGHRISSHPGGMAGLWSAMAGAAAFEVSYLVSARKTVGQIIGGL